jgi:endoglycosylceramidase
MHQDLISRYFCGEGMPDWAVPTPSEHFPAPLAWLNLSFEANNYPTLESCLQHPFAEFYPTAAVAETFQALYSNTGGLGDAMAQFWGAVAQRFQNNTYVLGYELLNEPFAGDIYRDPGLLLPGVTDARYLLPLYQKMHTAIRQYDQNHIIFFEPMVFDIGPSGFNEGPGGPAYNDRQVYSFHIYCQPTDKGGDPTDMRACSIEDELYWDLAMSDLKRMNLGGMLTEFGAVNDSETAVEMIDYLTGLADTAFMSWAYWQFKFYQDLTTSGPAESFYFADGSLAQAKVQALSRTHAQAIAGRPLSTTFNATTNAFSLSYQYDAAVSAPTVVYLNKPMRYPSGYSVQVSPAGSVDWTFSNNQLLFIPSTNTTHLADGTTVTIQIGPAFP